MNHFFFAIYLLTLLSSVALLPVLWVRHRQAKAFIETFLILLIQSCLVFLGLGLLYIKTQFSIDHSLFDIFLALSMINLGAMIYLIPRQITHLFDVKIPSWVQRTIVACAFLSGLSAIALGFHWFGLFSVFLVLPLLSLVIVVVWAQIIYARSYQTINASPIPKIVGMALPLFGVITGMVEGIFFPENLFDRGVSVSLPLTLMLANFCLWWFSRDFFIEQNSEINVEIKGLSELTDKESEVVILVARGYSNKKIAQDLSISPSTVKNHLYSSYKKLGVTHRYALMKIVEKSPAKS